MRTLRYFFKKPRIFFFHASEIMSGTDILFRKSRPIKEYIKLLPSILESHGLDPQTKCVWSQTAGCKCGCSPGFIVDAKGRWDIAVIVSGMSMADDETRKAFVDRTTQLLSDLGIEVPKPPSPTVH